MSDTRENRHTGDGLQPPEEAPRFRWTAERLRRALEHEERYPGHLDDEALASCLDARESDAHLRHLLHCASCRQRLLTLIDILGTATPGVPRDKDGSRPLIGPLAFALHISGRSGAAPRLVACSQNIRVHQPEAARLRAVSTDLRLEMGEICPIANLTFQLQRQPRRMQEMSGATDLRSQRWTLRASLRATPLDIELRHRGQLLAALHCPQTHLLVPDLRSGFFELHLSSPDSGPQFALLLLQSE